MSRASRKARDGPSDRQREAPHPDRPEGDPTTKHVRHPEGPLAEAAASARSIAAAAAGSVQSVASAAAESVESAAESVGAVASAARRGVARRTPRPRTRRRARTLPLLYDVHPEARRASPREVGLEIVPLDQIRGTAVEGSAQRGPDFRPLPALRGADWDARWQRILGAMERLETLPPVDLVKFGDGYWITDGHNRIAAGRAVGQVAVDAHVIELRPAGTYSPVRRIAPYLTQSAELQAVGSGRRTRTAEMFQSVDPEHVAHERRSQRELLEDVTTSSADEEP